jgi:hypothetical protein
MRTAHLHRMNRIADALELLTSQHDEIDALIAELAATASPSTRNETISQLVEKLAIHLGLEQELFYPAVSAALSPVVYAELLAEHGEIKRVLADMLWLESEDVRFARKLAALQSLQRWHSMWQERELFETLAETMNAEQLAELGSRLNAWLDGAVADLAIAA